MPHCTSSVANIITEHILFWYDNKDRWIPLGNFCFFLECFPFSISSIVWNALPISLSIFPILGGVNATSTISSLGQRRNSRCLLVSSWEWANPVVLAFAGIQSSTWRETDVSGMAFNAILAESREKKNTNKRKPPSLGDEEAVITVSEGNIFQSFPVAYNFWLQGSLLLTRIFYMDLCKWKMWFYPG